MSSGSNGVLGQVIGAVVGIVVGVYTENPQLGFAAYSITAGVSTLLLAGKAKAVNGPLLSDLSVQLSTEGTVVPIIFGRMRVAGNVVWGTQKIPHGHSSGGGKGSSTPATNTTTYTQSFAISFARGVLDGYGRIWLDKKLMIDFTHAADAATIIASDFLAKSIRFYPGDDEQLPDPLIVSYEGVGNSTARRGTCYLVFEDLEIDQFGERIPQIEVELFGNATPAVTHTNICALTPDDQGSPGLGGPSWISDREIWYWRPLSGGTDFANLAMFHSTDGQPGVYTGIVRLPTATANAAAPVNTASIPHLETILVVPQPGTTSSTQTLYIRPIGPTTDVGPATDENGIVEIRLQDYSGDDYVLATDLVRMTAFDEESEVVAFALRIQDRRYYAERISVFPGGEYLLRSGTGVPECQALACANGNVYALVFFPDSLMHLLVLDQLDASLISDFPGPAGPYSPEGVAGAMPSIRVVGSTVWAFAESFAWKWYGDGTFTLLSDVVTFKDDSGRLFDGISGQQCYVGDDHVILQGEASADPAIFRHQLVRFNAPTALDVPLSTIVTALCDAVGVSCDATELETTMVSGFAVTRQMSAVEALNYLAAIYYFDGVPTDTGVYFKLRGGDPVMTINTVDLAAHDFGAEWPDALTEDRDKEIDIPQYFAVNYTNIDNDYLQGSIPALRLNAYSQQVATLDATAVAMTATQAAQLAETAKITSWIERTRNTFAGDYRLKALQKSDVVLIDDGQVLRRRRITSVKDQQGLMQFECVADDASAYASPRTSSGASSTSAIRVPLASELALLDIAPLQDSDQGPMVYAKVTPQLPVGSTTAWSGATLLRTDDDSNEAEGSVTGRSLVGVTLDALPEFSGPNIIDEGSSFTAILRGGGLPQSLTRDQLFQAKAGWVVGSEVIGARDVTLVSGNIYRFSGLLRYQRGTEGVTHDESERVVFLERADMLQLINDAAKPGVPRTFTAVSGGRSIDTGTSASITSTDRFRQCFAPVNLHAEIGLDAIYFSWNRRTRLMHPDAFVPGFRSDEQDKYVLKTESAQLSFTSETGEYPNISRYLQQLRGEPTDFHASVAQISRDEVVGAYSAQLLVHGGVAPNPKSALFISTTATDGTTTFVNSGGLGMDVATVGAVHVTSNRAVFAGSTDAIVASGLPEQLFGFGIGIFEIRMKFKTSATGILMSHSTPAFDFGSWRVKVEDIGGFNGIVTFYFADFALTGPLLQSPGAAGDFRDGVEHELRIYAPNATGNSWQMSIDGVSVASSARRNIVGGSFPSGVITIGNDANVVGQGFVGTVGDPCINLFPGL